MKRCLSSCAHTVAVLVLLGGDQRLGPLALRTSSPTASPTVLPAALAQPSPCSSASAPSARTFSVPCHRRRPPMARFLGDTAEGLHSESKAGGGTGSKADGDLEGSMVGKSAPGATGTERDSAYMLRALELAARGLGRTRPNPAVGCVIVDKEGVVIGEGFHPKAGEPHAEVWAIRQARERARGATAYVTLEPCNHFGRTPPCTSALLDSGVSRVVAGMVDPDPRTAGGGLRRLAERGLDVSVGVEAAACQALNAPFAHRIWEKACYGVLHCSLGGAESSELEDTCQEAGLTLPPACHSYDEHDAIVVEGRSGVTKLEACMKTLPSTALRVVVVTSIDGIDGELGPVSESRLWEDSPDGTVLVFASEGSKTTPSPIRAHLTSRGVNIVEFAPLSTPQPPRFVKSPLASAQEAAAKAVSRELYRRGMLSAVWDVSPGLATRALEGGQIQRVLVRKRRIGDVERGIPAAAGSEGAPGAEKDEADGEAVVRAIDRLCGREGSGVRVRVRREGILPGGASEMFTEVVLPVPALDTVEVEADSI